LQDERLLRNLSRVRDIHVAYLAFALSNSGGRAVATITIHDRADEFRIEIVGRFSGDIVNDAAAHWKNALRETPPRRFTVDISRLNGYDYAGCKLLSKMYHHGAHFAASTPLSLVFLNEISLPVRRKPALVRTMTPGEVKRGGTGKTKITPPRAAAAGAE
jgi:hypothetical protein